MFKNPGNLAPEVGVDSSLVLQSGTETGLRKVKLVKICEELTALYNSPLVCRFVLYPAGVSIRNAMGLFRSVTGWDASPPELLRGG